jgi:two-component system response regulator GlrR
MNASKKHILVVDDDPGILRLLSIRLTAAGYEVMCVESGQEALEHLLLSPPHLVVTDLDMPSMDGLALCEAIRQHQPELPIILLTACCSTAHVMAAHKYEVFCVLPKPFESQSLLTQIAKAVHLPGARPESEGAGCLEQWQGEVPA